MNNIKINRFSLHKIENEDKFSFKPEDYSLFKFGDISKAERFGKELFEGLKKPLTEIVLKDEIVIFPSPYMAIPTASNYLTKYFKKSLDGFLYSKGLASSKMGKIHRNQTYTVDYGNLSFEQRKNLIANDTYYIDKNTIENKTCIFVDDIRITGSHEYTVNKILEQYQVNGNFIFIYFAELINKDINPKIENYFNYYKVNSVEILLDLMNSVNFRFNTRVIKYILNLSDEKFDYVMDTIPKQLRDNLINYAISNDYHLINEYKNNLKKIYYGYQFTEGTEAEY